MWILNLQAQTEEVNTRFQKCQFSVSRWVQLVKGHYFSYYLFCKHLPSSENPIANSQNTPAGISVKRYCSTLAGDRMVTPARDIRKP